LSEDKKTFTITYPKIKAATPALSRKIEQTIDYEKTNGLNIQEEKTENQWLEEAYYEVGYNKKGVLSITLYTSGWGAYPSVYSKTVVVDLKTGNRITPQTAFTNFKGLAAKVKMVQTAEVKKSLEELTKDPANKDYEPFDFFDNTDFTAKNLSDFAVDDKGVTFIFDYGFPHVVQVLQPDGGYFFSWAEIKPFIKRDGLLAKFIR
ncbi:MAG: hypothetical protein ABIP06_07630, partial [Pyrinomonadaceae bacterium]